MGFIDGIFGGGTESVDRYTSGQKQLLDQLTTKIGGGTDRWGIPHLGAMDLPIDAYEGQIAPGATANQLAAFQGAGGLMGNAQGYVDPTRATQQALSGDLAYQMDPAARERFFNEAILGPGQRDFQDTLQQLDHRYGARFGRSGAQLGAAQEAGSDFSTNLMAQRAQLAYQDDIRRQQLATDAANRQVQGIGLAQQGNTLGNNMRAQNLGLMSDLGNQERSIEGQQNAEDFYKWQAQQAYNNPWLGFLGTALSAQATAQVPSQGLLGGALQGALLGGAVGGPYGAVAGGVLGGADTFT